MREFIKFDDIFVIFIHFTFVRDLKIKSRICKVISAS